MKRLVLLGVSLAAFGALMVAGGFAQETSTAVGTFAGPVSGGAEPSPTCDPTSLAVSFLQTDDQIPSDGAYYPVADILAGESDPNCDYNLTSLEVTDNGSAEQSCPPAVAGPSADAVVLPWDFALDPADVTPSAPPPSTDGDLYTFDPAMAVADPGPEDTNVNLTLEFSDTGDCTLVVSGAEVTGTFEEQATEATEPVAGASNESVESH
ncbi:MAG TPA: hypothetical protein VI759_02315 [Dehalococcoidia bacterium]|nr:hypothetical protein [Dehalococcoidia bacterium]